MNKANIKESRSLENSETLSGSVKNRGTISRCKIQLVCDFENTVAFSWVVCIVFFGGRGDGVGAGGGHS